MSELGLVAAFLGGALLLAVVAVRFGILIGRRLDRAMQRDDEEPQ